MPELMRLSEWFAMTTNVAPGTYTDDDIDVVCPVDKEHLHSTECLVHLRGNKTVYECRKHHRAVATIRDVGGGTPSADIAEGVYLRVPPDGEQRRGPASASGN